MCNCRDCFILVSALEIQCERDRMRRFVERWNNEAELLSPEKTFSRCFPDSRFFLSSFYGERILGWNNGIKLKN